MENDWKKVLRLCWSGDDALQLDNIGISFPDFVVDGEPVESATVFFDQESVHVTAGLWRSEPGAVQFESYPFDEFCWIVEGELRLSQDGEGEHVFRAGDAFLIKKGFRGEWRMPVALTKYYVELR